MDPVGLWIQNQGFLNQVPALVLLWGPTGLSNCLESAISNQLYLGQLSLRNLYLVHDYIYEMVTKCQVPWAAACFGSLGTCRFRLLNLLTYLWTSNIQSHEIGNS